jgi:hypothetical protein
MSLPGSRTIFYGPIVNPISHSSFQALPRCLLAVGPTGHIEWIVEDVHESALLGVLAQHGSTDIPLVVLRHGEFLLPGFVDTHTVRSARFSHNVRACTLLTNDVCLSIARTAGSQYRQVRVLHIVTYDAHAPAYHQRSAV